METRTQKLEVIVEDHIKMCEDAIVAQEALLKFQDSGKAIMHYSESIARFRQRVERAKKALEV